METEQCKICFYWHKCPICEYSSILAETAGWCKKHSAFTKAVGICEFGIHYNTRHVFKTSYAKSPPF